MAEQGCEMTRETMERVLKATRELLDQQGIDASQFEAYHSNFDPTSWRESTTPEQIRYDYVHMLMVDRGIYITTPGEDDEKEE